MKFQCDKLENQFILQDGDKDYSQQQANLSIYDKQWKTDKTIREKSNIITFVITECTRTLTVLNN